MVRSSKAVASIACKENGLPAPDELQRTLRALDTESDRELQHKKEVEQLPFPSCGTKKNPAQRQSSSKYRFSPFSILFLIFLFSSLHIPFQPTYYPIE